MTATRHIADTGDTTATLEGSVDSTGTLHHSAHPAFVGLVPSVAVCEQESLQRAVDRGRLGRGALATGSVLLAGSMAAMTFNLTGPVEPVDAAQPLKPRDATTEFPPTIRESMASARTDSATAASTPGTAESSSRAVPAAVPASYRVQAGDTVSSIAGAFGLSTASVLALNGLSWSSLIFPGQELTLSRSGPVTVTEPPAAAPTASGRYTIAVGDTIASIAERFGVSTLSVLSANGLGWSSIIYPGQTLLIPGLIGPGTPAVDADSSSPEAGSPIDAVPVVDKTPIAGSPSAPNSGTPVAQTPPAVAPPAETPPSAPVETPEAPVSNGSYTISSGDTLSSIAAKFGITTQSLLDANGLGWSSIIYPGSTLVIPGASTPVAPPVTSPASSGGSVTVLNDEMRANAAIIVQVGRELGVPDYGIVIALATAMQESSLRNLSWGDRDSVGLFQQRPSSGWGSVEQLTTPSYAARLFYGGPSNPNRGYTRGLLDISGWQSMPLTVAAQRVQISGHPDAYAKWETSARAWLAELG